jgi:putative ABC transport system permease protein
VAWILASLRRLRDGRATAIALVMVAGVTAFVFAAAPRLLEETADGIIVDQVAATPVEVRSLLLTEERRIPADVPAPLGEVAAEGDALAARLPRGVRSLIASRSYVVDSARWSVTSAVRSASTIRLRFQEGAFDRVRVTAGTLPELAATPAGDPGRPLPVALAAAAARTLGVGVGDTIDLSLDPSDRLALGRAGQASIEVVALFEPLDPSDPYWFGDPTSLRSVVRSVGPNVAFEDVTALLAPASYPTLVALTDETALPFRYSWRYVVDPERLQSAAVERTSADLRRLETLFAAPGGRAVDPGPTVQTGLLAVVDAFRARWAASSAVLLVVGLGAAAVALLALGLVASLAARRRRFALALSRSRGASRLQVAGSIGTEGIALAGPAAAAGVAVALRALPTGSAIAPVALAATVAVLSSTLLVVFARDGSAVDDDPGRAGPWRSGGRRLAAEALVAVLAIAGAALLRQRGVVVAGEGGAGAGAPAIDPLIVVVPVLVGVAAGLLAVRLFPLPMAAAARLAATRRDLVPVLALRRATRGGTSGPVMVVLLATATISAFSSATVIHLDRAADAAAWQAVGAAVRVSGEPSEATATRPGTIVPLPDGFDPSTLPGVEEVAEAHRGTVRLFPRGTVAQLLAVDAPAYRAVVAGTPADPRLPSDLSGPAAGPLPAIVSPTLPTTPAGPRVGDVFQATIAGEARDLRVAAVRDSFPSVEPGTPFIVVASGQLGAIVPADAVPATDAFLRVADAGVPAVRDAVAASGPGVSVTSRADVAAGLRSSPFVGAIGSGIAAAALVAALYAALAVAVALALSGAARAVEVAQLRTLGLSRRQGLGLIVLEHGPTLAVAFAVGIATGFGLFLLLRPGLGLDAIVEAPIAVPLAVDVGHLAVILGAMIVIVGIGIALAAAIQQRAVLALAVRGRIE